jgi:hypothetical protein
LTPESPSLSKPCSKQRDAYASDGVEYPEKVLLRVLVNHHVATYLSDVKAIVPYLYQTDCLIGNNVEDKDVKRVVACIDKKPFQNVVFPVKQHADVVCHQESQKGRNRERQELDIA